jgi:hypothetical protein
METSTKAKGVIMSNTLIGNVNISPSSPRPAESFRVEILDTDGNSYSNQPGAAVYIDGIPGAVQYLQAAREGKRPILIRVKMGDETEMLSTEITIAGNPLTFHNSKGEHEPALLSVKQVMSSPYEVAFLLGVPPSRSGKRRIKDFHHARVSNVLDELLESRKKTDQRTLVRAILGGDKVYSVTTQKSKLNRRKFVSKADVTTAVVDLGSADISDLLQAGQGKQPSFEWDFGDGTKQTTSSPYVMHDYSKALTADGEVLHFEVRCRAVLDNIEVARTLVLHSAYVLCKHRGTIVPPVKADIYAHKHFNSFYGMLEVTNLEEEPITITSQAVVPLTDNPDAQERPVFRNLKSHISLPPLSTAVVGVYPRYRSPMTHPLVTLSAGISPQVQSKVDVGLSTEVSRQVQTKGNIGLSKGLFQQLQSEGDVPRDAPGFTVYFAGQTASGTPVRFTHVFEIHMEARNKEPEFPGFKLPELGRRPWPWEEVMTTIDEILRQKVNPVELLNVEIEKDLGIIAVSASSMTLKGKNTPLKAIAREISQVGLVPMQKLAPQFIISSPRHTTARASTGVMPDAPAGGDVKTMALSKDMIAKAGPKAIPDTQMIVNPASMTLFLDESGIWTYRADKHQRRMTLCTKEGPPPPGPVVEGEVCDPDNISDLDKALADSQQLVCQLSDEKMDACMPGRFMNGRKGDIILSPGGPGLIGSLLRAVDPPQKYSHSGMMTRNYDEVTHSTASEDRIYDYLGEDWTDPESGKRYSISSFSGHAVGVTHNDHFEIVPPLVVKPDPMLETSQIRQKLHTVSSTARNDGAEINDAGNLIRPYRSHYRLFCYTNPAIGLTDIAPTSSKWATGTYPSVCSSYVWMSLKKNNVRLEGDSDIVHPTDLEVEDIAQGAGVLPTTKDGLYWYTAAERLAAGTWLYNEMHYKAYDEAGWFGDLLSDAADDVGNQLVNTFALNDAWGKDHDDWKDTQDANAVSPDNILFWDGPTQAGLYGYPEPLIYREPRKEEFTVSRWKKVLSRGTVTGTVRLNGQPVQGALVTLYDGMSDITDGNGVYSMADVPFGGYQLTASKVIGGIYYSVKVNVVLNQEILTLNVDLEPPSDRYRLAQLYIDFYGREDEDFASDETTNPGPEYYELELGPDRLTNHKYREYKWGGEARVEYDITVLLLVDNSIQVNVNAVLYEGTSESTNDLDGTATVSFNVPKDQTKAGYIKVVNTDEDEPDTYGELTLSVKNAQNNN